MQIATDQALAEVEKIAELLELFLMEAPIGNEYGVLSESDWQLGNAFLEWLEAKGIQAFEELGDANSSAPSK